MEELLFLGIHPFQSNISPTGSQYIIEKSSPVNPPTSAIWTQVTTFPGDSTSFIDNISICSSWINYRVRLNTSNCDFISNLDGGFIEDQQAPDPPTINFVTNDTSNNQIYIDWSSSVAQDVMAYIIFKFSNGSGTRLILFMEYKIHLTMIQIHPLFKIMWFNMPLQPWIAVALVIPQFNTSSAGLAHNNILLSTNYDQCTGSVELSWNEYINWSAGLANYYIYFINDSTNSWSLLDSTNSLNYSYAIQQGNMNYQFIIEANSDSLDLKSNSNVIDFYANQPPIPQLSYISQVDVLVILFL